MDRILKLCEEIGFSYFNPLDVGSLQFLPQVRDMCSADRCKSFNRSWACPPAVAPLDVIVKKVSGYKSGIIVRTVGSMEDEFDLTAIRDIQNEHKKKFETLVRQVKAIYPQCMPMSSGTCTRCRKCTYPDRPCRFPDRVFPSMEAYGLLVSDVRQKSGLKYYYGKNTISYTACILI